MITSKQLRQKFLDFHKSKNHSIIPSSPLVPKEDPTVLFNTAGMQPVIPYLLGIEKHLQGNMLANSQKCIRTDDIEEVGDNRHLTFFEMLGNWSIGAYFKKEIIEWSMEFLTSNEWLNLDPRRIFVTVYQGNEKSFVSVDQEAIQYWQEQYKQFDMQADVGFSGENHVYRIRKLNGKDNWWGLPYRGPCGPCSEMYYLLPHNPIDFEEKLFPHMNQEEIEDFIENQIVEIGNNVFMSYIGEKDENKEPINLEPMKEKNIDTGLGFERFLTVVNGYNTVYETDLFTPIIDVIDKYC
jgi:alanyl-tRNA synthetase